MASNIAAKGAIHHSPGTKTVTIALVTCPRMVAQAKARV